jgi:hypothetical protein
MINIEAENERKRERGYLSERHRKINKKKIVEKY